MSRQPDWTITLRLYRLTGDLHSLNARLARMGIDETIVPVTPACEYQAPIYRPATRARRSSSTIKLYRGRKYLAPGDQGVMAAQALPDGKIALVQGAMKPAYIPPCFATVAHTPIDVLPSNHPH